MIAIPSPTQPYEGLYRGRTTPLWGDSPGRLVAQLPNGTGRVLDAGCGDGKNALHLERLGYSVVGVDHAPSALELLKHRFDAAGHLPRGHYLLEDVRDWIVPAESVDVLVSYGLYHCLPRTERISVHRGLQGAVRRGGRVLFCTLLDGIPISADHSTPGVELPSASEVNELWAGFEVIDVTRATFESEHAPLVGPHQHEGLWLSARRT